MSRPRHLPPWLWAPVVLGADFAAKRVVLAHADSLRPGLRVLGDLLRFAYVRNAGAAMGLFHGGRYLLIAVSGVTSLLLLALYRRTDSRKRLRRGALAAILGGALGNLVDRTFYGGAVVDFIDIGVGPHRFYTFNVADMGVTLGAAALLLALAFDGGRRVAASETDAALSGPQAAPLAADDGDAGGDAIAPEPGPADPSPAPAHGDGEPADPRAEPGRS